VTREAELKSQAEHGIEITHRFMYAKDTRIPEGVVIEQHVHKYDHYSMLLEGTACVTTALTRKVYTAPAIIKIQAGVAHSVEAKTRVIWWCLHETDERDLSKIDESLAA
jgi:quercetin dioxygenase-like cupin family protein